MIEDIYKHLKTAKNVKLFTNDRVLRCEDRDIEDVKWQEEFGREYFLNNDINLPEFELMIKTIRPDLKILN